MEFLTERQKKEFNFRELDAGAAANVKVSPMKFAISHYEAAGFGHLVIMQGKAMFGLMKMDTVIFTPVTRDAPLFSYDRIKAMGNDTCIVELYDTLLDKSLYAGYDDLQTEKDRMSAVPDHDLGEHWYDYMKMPASLSKRGKGCSEVFDKGYEAFFGSYLAHLGKAPVCEAKDKREKTLEYVNGLFENGGPSTDAFVKGMGREAAEKLFKEVIFGIDKCENTSKMSQYAV